MPRQYKFSLSKDVIQETKLSTAKRLHTISFSLPVIINCSINLVKKHLLIGLAQFWVCLNDY